MLKIFAAIFPSACKFGLVLMASAGFAQGALASITGVCPDGSIYIVQHRDAIPCRNSKAVDPSDVPPLRPEYLPRRYGWEVFNRQQDPNNPYNLIRSAEPTPPAPVRDQRRAMTSSQQPVTEARIRQSASAPNTPAPTTSMPGPVVRLEDLEAQDLAMIVDLRQKGAPASIRDAGSHARLQVARSEAFEARMLARLAQYGDSTNHGPVVLFTADGQSGGAFYGNLTFVQGGTAYHPDREDPSQLGLLRGRLGEIPDGSRVLGYVVLPEHLNASAPMDIYWNDVMVTATLQP